MRYTTSLFQTPITRVFTVRDTARMGVASVSAWTLAGAPLFATKLWPILVAELGKDAVLDSGIPKSYGEVLVTGRAFAPGGAPVSTVPVCVQLGAIDKRVHVIGDREWAAQGPTEPLPFTEMPLTWERAFGGEGFASNPVGKGAVALEVDGRRLHPLPNLERPGRLVTSPRERPAPTSLGPIDMTWPERFERIGTYDARWYEERFPALADDIDWRFFNVASRDQQIEGLWRGDERFVLEGLDPERPHIEGTLPGVAASVFVTRGPVEGAELIAVPMRLTTVWFVPHRDLVVLVHHGSVDVQRDDGTDLTSLVGALEWVGRSRGVEHYREVVRKRLDPEWGSLHALRDSDLMPEGMQLPTLAEDVTAIGLEPEGRLQANLRRRIERGLEELRTRVVAAGLDPDEVVPALDSEPDEPVDLDELPAMIEHARREAEEKQREVERHAAEQRAELARMLEAAGLDPRPAERERPLFTAAKHIELLSALTARARAAGQPLVQIEQQLQDPALHRELLEQEDQFREAYRTTGHHWSEGPAVDLDEAARLRALVLEHIREGWSLVEQDLTGADLSELDLRTVDLRGAWLEGANLQSADLSSADLRGAILVRADLSDAIVNRTKLAGANLGSARLLRVRAPDGIDLRQAVLAKTDLRGALLPRALLAGADLSGARFDGTELAGIDAPGMTLIETSLRGTRLAGANLEKANLFNVELDGVDLSHARLSQVTFLTCRGEGARFVEADLRNIAMVEGCAFERADFRRAQLTMANLRGVRLAGADFTDAVLDQADLSEADLERANFHHAALRRSRFVRATLADASMVGANLMEAILQEATLTGTDLRGSNLFAADLWKVRSDERTDVRHALVKRARFVPKERARW